VNLHLQASDLLRHLEAALGDVTRVASEA
jgi:hypothetical protein